MKKSHSLLALLSLAVLISFTLWSGERRRNATLGAELAALNQQSRLQAEELHTLQDLKTQAQQIAATKLDLEELQTLRKEHSELLRLRSELARLRDKSSPYVPPSAATPLTRPPIFVSRPHGALSEATSALETPSVDPQREPAFAQYVATPGNRVNWSPGQAAGAPDTHQAGDITTAWASQSPDGGHEWLQLEYERPVELAQVRIRETYNPGAVSAITAMLDNGTEVPLWEGQEAKAEAPVEVEFDLPAGITSRMLRVHLDTSRVSGWNEIDAVELIGRDGTRQWAKSVSASSYYGQNRPRDYGVLDSPPPSK